MNASPNDGGRVARRAVVRWAARLVRRDRRQYALIMVLLGVAVAALVLLTSAAYNIAPAAGQAEFGDADHGFVHVAGEDPDSLEEWRAAGVAAFGAIDLIGVREVPVPGSLDNVTYRAQDVDGPYVDPLVDVRVGDAPAARTEAAITDGIADLLSVSIGDTVDLDGVQRAIVGIVENPSDLDDEFVLLPPTELVESESVTMLADAGSAQVRQFGAEIGAMRVAVRSTMPEDVLAGVLMLLAGTVLLALVALVAAASFTVIAQRRLPQIGMLAAIGATERHVRLSMVAAGVVTGVVASFTGAAAGIAGWLTLAPAIESTVNHRIDRTNVPWWLVVVGMLLTVVTGTIAAWWPARTVARIPPVMALSGRTPRPAQPRRSSSLAVALVAVGVASLYTGSDVDHRGPNAIEALLLVLGTIAVVGGVLLVSPIVIAGVGRVASFVPVAGRLALRDLSRSHTRSTFALAAIGLALGIPSVVVASTAAAENASPLGNLAATQLLIRPDDVDGPFVPDAGEVAQMATGVRRVADVLDATSVVRLDVVRDPASPPEPGIDKDVVLSVALAVDNGWEHIDNVYVATPELLAVLGLDTGAVPPSGIVTSDDGDVQVFHAGVLARPRSEGMESVASPGTLPATYTSLPSALIDPNDVVARGLQVAPSGRWLLTTGDPIDADTVGTARDVAARFGFVIEARESDSQLATVRLGAGLVGLLLAFGVLAATVGLMRGESANELRALTAAGATRVIRRGITAVTAATLAGFGAVLGIVSAYVGLAAGRVAHLTPLPWRDLAAIALATPLLAGAVAWVVGGREPAGVARRPLD